MTGRHRVAESDEEKPGVILDYDEQGHLLSIEVLDASRRVTEAHKIELPEAIPIHVRGDER